MTKRIISIIVICFIAITSINVSAFASDNYDVNSDAYEWSEWSTTVPPAGVSYETKTQYSYRNKQFVYNGYYNYSGYTRSATKLVENKTGSWSRTSTKPSDNPGEKYRTIVSCESKIAQYSFAYICSCKNFFHFNSGGSHSHSKDKRSYTGNLFRIYHSTSLPKSGYTKEYQDGRYGYECNNQYETGKSYKLGTVYYMTYKGDPVTSFKTGKESVHLWLWQSSDKTKTVYRPITKKYQYTHWKWGGWSSWQDSSVAASANREIKTRTVYRYKKLVQTISCDDTYFTRYGQEPFSLNASANTALSYTSSDTSIATVSSKGVVTVKKTGTVTITIQAAEDDIYKSAKKTVTLNVEKGYPYLAIEDGTIINKTYSDKGFYLGATAKSKLDYKSSDTSVLIVNENGFVQMKKAGSATVTITTDDDNYITEWIDIQINISKSKQSITCKVANTVNKKYGNDAFSLGAKAKSSLTYSTSNKSVATVSSKGKVTIKNPGTAVITIKAAANDKYKGVTKKITVNVALKTPSLDAYEYKSNGVRKVKLSWTKPYGAHGYEIYAYVPSSEKSNKIKITDSNKKSIVISGYPKGVTYKYKIRAYRTVNGKKVYSPYSPYKKVYFSK